MHVQEQRTVESLPLPSTSASSTVKETLKRKNSDSSNTSNVKGKKRRTPDELSEDEVLWKKLKPQPQAELNRNERQNNRLEGWKKGMCSCSM